MSRNAAAARSGLSVIHQIGRWVRVIRMCALVSRNPTHRKLPPHRNTQFLFTSDLTHVAACLAMIFVSCVVLEAFDKDIALWPFGTEEFTALPQDHIVSAVYDACAFSAPRAANRFVMTAGAQLVLRYRARSGLGADGPVNLVVFHWAEPWGVTATGAPALGPYVLEPESTADA
jgi:hypothetical protein